MDEQLERTAVEEQQEQRKAAKINAEILKLQEQIKSKPNLFGSAVPNNAAAVVFDVPSNGIVVNALADPYHRVGGHYNKTSASKIDSQVRPSIIRARDSYNTNTYHNLQPKRNVSYCWLLGMSGAKGW